MSIQVFENPEFELRVSPDGESFRVEAPGLARALGFRDSYAFIRSIPEAEKGYTAACTPGGDQHVWYVTEPGFYRALGQRQASRIKNDAAREMVTRFQGWVYGEVLPAMRRAGGYSGAVEFGTGITGRLAEIAHQEHVVPASARVLAYHRWNNPQKGMAAFESVCVQLQFDIRPLSPGTGTDRKEIAGGE